MRRVWSTVLLLFALFFGVPRVQATGEFLANYDVQYAVSPAGKTIVTQQIKLVNQLSNYYPQSYSLLIDSDKIANIIAYDDGGIITPDISVKDGKTSINLKFNAKAVGIGKILSFTLRYEHGGVAAKNGNIWELYVPGVVNDPDIGEYNVTLNVPPTFGPVAYLSPLPAQNHTWTKDQMIRGGIAAAYGASQNFAVKLSYTLTNPSVTRQQQTIALPASSAYQKAQIQSLEPKPDSVQNDEDGNWLATYTLLPAQTLTIKAVLSIGVYLHPRKDYTPLPIDSQKYLNPAPFWQSTDSKITDVAKNLPNARAIYDYVANTLSYNYDAVNQNNKRQGALGALANPKLAVCMEFTDLFIALARARGIPARRVVGYAYTNNPKLRPISAVGDVLHAWPEYYDTETKVWVPIDPTWANTTGGVDYFSKTDFNHIAFAVNGLDSELPYAAGFYRGPNTQGKDISVEFEPSPPDPQPAKLETKIDFPTQVGARTKVTGYVVISNTGGETASNIVVSATSDIGGVALTETIPTLLPYGSVRVPIHLSAPAVLQSQNGVIQIVVNDISQSKQFTVQPLYWLMVGIALVVVSSLLLIFIVIRIIVWRKHSPKH